MFGLSAIFGWFSFVKGVALSGVVGAVIGAGAAFLGRLFPSIGTLFVAAALGAIVMVGAFNGGYIGASKSNRIAQLEAMNARLELELRANREVAEKEQELAAARQDYIDEQDKLLAEIQEAIDAHGDAECKVGAFKDEIDAIRKLK